MTKRTKKVWITSSPRLGYSPEQTKRWLYQAADCVYPEDDFILLGHLAFNHASLFQDFTSMIPGRKRVIVSPFDTRSIRWYQRAGFEVVLDAIPMITEYCSVLLSFIPAEGRLVKKDLAALPLHLRLRAIFRNKYFLNIHGYHKSRSTFNSLCLYPGIHDLEAVVDAKVNNNYREWRK